MLSLVVLAALFAWGVSGYAGGRRAELTQAGPAATLRVRGPEFIRTGDVFESSIEVTAHRPIGKLVIAASPSLWRDLTLNSMTPAPAEETFESDRFRFTYGMLKPGDRFEVKLDFQINPTLFGTSEGRVAVYDGNERLAEVAVSMHVLP